MGWSTVLNVYGQRLGTADQATVVVGGAVVAEGNGGSLGGVSRQRNIGNLHQNPSVCLSVSDVLGGAQR